MGHRSLPLRRLKGVLASEAFWVALAFAARAAFAFALGEGSHQADEAGYSRLARGLAFEGLLGSGGERMVASPGAPAFFSLFFGLSDSFLRPRLGQAALSAATAWLLGRMTRDLTGSRRAGLAALAAAAVYPFFIYYSGMLLTETLYVAASAGALWATCRSLRERGRDPRLAALAGGAWALAGLTRTEGVPVALVLWLALAGLAAAGRYSRRSAALAALCWALPLAGWAARNKAVCGRATLDLHGGMTLLHGTMLYDIDQMDTLYADQAFRQTELYRRGQALEEAERDRLYFRAGLAWMAEHPAQTVRQWAQKAVAFWRFYPRPDKLTPEGSADPHLGLRRGLLVAVSLLTEPALILLGFWGAWRRRGELAYLFPLYWMVLATFAVHVVVVSQMRYRLPVMPVLLLFACSLIPSRKKA